jgi:hypothetical protein
MQICAGEKDVCNRDVRTRKLTKQARETLFFPLFFYFFARTGKNNIQKKLTIKSKRKLWI